MKRILCLICCILLLPIFSACGNRKNELQEPANFYYLNSNIAYNTSSGVISAEQREAILFHDDLVLFLKSYLKGPTSLNLEAVIPSTVTLESCAYEDGIVYIAFSEDFSKLSGTRLTIACSALLMSLNEYMGASGVNVCANGELIDGKEEFQIFMDDLVLIDPIHTEE